MEEQKNQENSQPQEQPAQAEQAPAEEAPQQQEQTQEAPAQEAPAAAPAAAGSNDVEENRAISYLSYLGLLFLVPMLVKKDSPFAQFHAKQGLVLVIASFVGAFLMPLFGLGLLVYLAVLVLSIMGLVNVHKGEMKDLPMIGDIAKKFNF